MIKDFITNLTILHKNHMLKIGIRTLAGAVSNGAHMVVCHAVRDIVTIFPRSFYYYSTDIHIPAGFLVKSIGFPACFIFLERSFSTKKPLRIVKMSPRSFHRYSTVTQHHFLFFNQIMDVLDCMSVVIYNHLLRL